MIMRFIFSGLVFVSLFVGNAVSWTYLDINEWPSVCLNGERQSPIQIWKNSVKRTFIPPLNFRNYKNTLRASLENNGHTVEIQIVPENQEDVPLLSGGNLEEYLLQNIHFHWDSEHVVNDRRYPLEGHYVHYKKEYGNLTNAVNHDDGIVVLAVMFRASHRENEKLRNIVESTQKVCRTVHTPESISNGFKVADILPKNIRNFYTYDGSLTTPGCNEAVKWIIFEEPLSIGRAQLQQLRNIQTATGELLTTNYRPCQNLNTREVLYSA